MQRILFILFFIYSMLFSITCFADELIVNGDFSSANPSYIPGWVTGSTYGGESVPEIHTNLYEPGPNGNSGNVCVAPGNSSGGYTSSWLSQFINVPRDTLGASITVYYQRFIPRGQNMSPDGNIYVRGDFASENIFFEQAPTTGSGAPTPTPGWRQVQKYLPLENYSGQTVTLKFEAHTDKIASAHYMHLDNISLDVITATKSATPTITLTFTKTFTYTITPTYTVTPTITPTYTITPTITKTMTITPWPVPGGDAIAFPNPASGDQVTFMYSLGAPADISIEIYNLRGYKVAHLEDNNKSAQINRKTTWDIRHIAPGVYLYQVIVKSTDGRISKNRMRRVVITK